MPDNDTWDSLARIIAELAKIDTECTSPEGLPGSAETLAAYEWLRNTAEYQEGNGAFVYTVTVPGTDTAVTFTASLVCEVAPEEA